MKERITTDGKHWCRKAIEEKNATYNLAYGGKNIGKSWQGKEFIAERYFLYGEKWCYIRRRSTEATASAVEQYFDTWHKTLKDRYKWDGVTARGGKIYLVRYDPDSGKKTEEEHFGYYANLVQVEQMTSREYDNVYNFIFDEFLSNVGYLDNEAGRLQRLISTVARSNTPRVWMFGNAISRNCPYYGDWGLVGVPKQKPGTIQTYHWKTLDAFTGEDIVTDIAVERCAEICANKGIIGRAAKVVNDGDWETEDVPHLPIEYSELNYDVVHEIVVRHGMFSFLCRLVIRGDFVGWYVVPKTTEIQPGTRWISPEASLDPMHTETFDGLTEDERPLVRNLRDGVGVYFCDNLTGADFRNTVCTITKKL